MGKLLQNYPIVITRGYGDISVGGYPHGGVDLVGNNGQMNVLDYICAFDSGTIVNVRKDCTGFEDNGSYGNFIHIDHGNGYSTVYAHLEYGSVNVNLGDKVEKGQVIAFMGNTGHSYGGHLHFEMRVDNIKTDPTEYVLGKELPSSLPIPVEQNLKVNQLYITCNDTIRVRRGHSTNDEIIGTGVIGYYNILNTFIDDMYTWCEVESNKWIACYPPYSVIVPKEDDTIIIRNQDKENPLIEFIKLLIELLKKILKKDKED